MPKIDPQQLELAAVILAGALILALLTLAVRAYFRFIDQTWDEFGSGDHV